METIKSLWQSNLMQLLLAGLISAIVAYLMASWQYRKQYKNGRVMLFEITKRYFIALNETHFVIQDQVKLVEEDLSQELYQNDLQLISEDLRKIFDNPVMIKYFEKYSELTYLTLAINRELVIREDKRRKKVLNPHTFNNFLKLYESLKKEMNIKECDKLEDVETTINNFKNILALPNSKNEDSF